jgi:acetyl esterase
MSGNPVLEEGFTLTKLLGSLYTEVKGGNEDQRPVIIAPDYRLIPENAYPIPINDTIDALQYAVANASTYGADSSRIILGGSSAGGHLTLVLALEVMEDNIKGLRKESLKALFLTVPMLCHPFHWQILFPSQPAPPSYKRVPEEFMGGSMAKRFWTRLATDHPPNDWRVSPLLGDFTGLPRVELFVAEGCPFVDEGKELSTRLEAKGVQVRTREYKRVQHMFIMSKDLAETKRYEEEYFQSWNEVLQHSR